jgi:hypothetical protein
MPELRWYFGYPFVLSVMFLVAFGMLVYFYRKGWLAPSIPTVDEDPRNHFGEGPTENPSLGHAPNAEQNHQPPRAS